MTSVSMEEIERDFDGQGYGVFKSAVAESIIRRLEPIQNRYNELMNNPEKLKAIYEAGDKEAREKTDKFLKEIYGKVGLIVD